MWFIFLFVNFYISIYRVVSLQHTLSHCHLGCQLFGTLSKFWLTNQRCSKSSDIPISETVESKPYRTKTTTAQNRNLSQNSIRSGFVVLVLWSQGPCRNQRRRRGLCGVCGVRLLWHGEVMVFISQLVINGRHIDLVGR